MNGTIQVTQLELALGLAKADARPTEDQLWQDLNEAAPDKRRAMLRRLLDASAEVAISRTRGPEPRIGRSWHGLSEEATEALLRVAGDQGEVFRAEEAGLEAIACIEAVAELGWYARN